MRLDVSFDLEQWTRLGFAVADQPLSIALVEVLKSEFERLIRDFSELPRPPVRFDIEDPNRQDNLEMLSHPHWASTAVEQIALCTDLGRSAALMLAVPSVRLWGTSFICKYSGATSKNDVSWHRDMTFWQCLSSPRLLTFWIALDSVSMTNGGLEYAAGSHIVGSANIGDDGDLESCSGFPLKGPAGIISAHHCLTGHRSGRNRSNRNRLALTLHYMDANLTYVPGTVSDTHINVSLIAHRNENRLDDYYFPVVYSS